MLKNTTTRNTLQNMSGTRVKPNYTIKTYIGMNDIIHIDMVDNETGMIFRNVMVDLKYNTVFDKNEITEELKAVEF